MNWLVRLVTENADYEFKTIQIMPYNIKKSFNMALVINYWD